MTTAESLAEAFEVQRRGDLQTAESVYRSVLAMEPANVNALQLLGLVCRATDRLAESEALLTAALNLRPDVAELHNNRGLCRLDQRQLLAAEQDFREALRRKNAYPEAWNNLGVVLRKQGCFQEAEQAYERALRLHPGYAEAYCNVGALLRQLGQLKQAEGCCRRALALRPDYPEAENNLGLVLVDQQRFDEAEACLRRSLALKPLPRSWCNLATLLRDTDRMEEAEACYRAALGLRQDDGESFRELGSFYLDVGRFEAAEEVFRKVVEREPTSATAWSALGAVLECRGQLAEAEQCHQQALTLDPTSAETLHDLGVLRMVQGRWEEGWPLLENRRRCPPIITPPSPQPLWDGSSLTGRTILLWAEQGTGDIIQFIRYARQVKDLGARVVLLKPTALADLLDRCPGVDQVIRPGEPLPTIDTHCPLMSLPGLFHTTPQTVPAAVPYLTPDPNLQILWKQRLSGLTGFKVGIVWRGNWQYKYDRRRSVHLSAFAPLAHLPNVQLISLQKDRGVEELAAEGPRLGIHDLGDDYQRGTFADTAAILKNLDLVVSVDTAVAHLAGALAVPVWLANRRDTDWRWLLEGGRTPWYPTMRIFRQPRHGEWAPVFEAMGKFLRHRAARAMGGK